MDKILPTIIVVFWVLIFFNQTPKLMQYFFFQISLSIWEVTNNAECGCVYFVCIVEMHNVVCHFGGKFKNELLSAYLVWQREFALLLFD